MLRRFRIADEFVDRFSGEDLVRQVPGSCSLNEGSVAVEGLSGEAKSPDGPQSPLALACAAHQFPDLLLVRSPRNSPLCLRRCLLAGRALYLLAFFCAFNLLGICHSFPSIPARPRIIRTTSCHPERSNAESKDLLFLFDRQTVTTVPAGQTSPPAFSHRTL
jgi:hypothetical protein